MASKKIFVVFGATGTQGGSVVKSILGDPKTAAIYTVRAVTRDATKPSATALKALGCEVVTADLDDKASLTAAIKGAYGVFAVTNFWEKKSAAVEVAQGKSVADVCKAEGVQHLVWSSLLNVTKLSGGVLDKVAHFDSKADVEEYIREIGVPASFFLPGFFMSNLPGKMLRPSPVTGAWTVALPIPPNSPIPLLDTEDDTGKFVKGIITHREQVLGKRILGATAYYTPAEIIEEFKELKPEAGKDAVAIEIPHAVFKGFLAKTGAPEFIQEEMLQNMRLMSEFGYYGGESFTESHSILDEPLTTWKDYILKSAALADVK